MLSPSVTHLSISLSSLRRLRKTTTRPVLLTLFLSLVLTDSDIPVVVIDMLPVSIPHRTNGRMNSYDQPKKKESTKERKARKAKAKEAKKAAKLAKKELIKQKAEAKSKSGDGHLQMKELVVFRDPASVICFDVVEHGRRYVVTRPSGLCGMSFFNS